MIGLRPNVLLSRVLFVIGALIYPLFGVAYTTFYPACTDPMMYRYTISFSALVALGASFWWPQHVLHFLIGLYWLIIAHFLYLLYVNELAVIYLMGFLVVTYVGFYLFMNMKILIVNAALILTGTSLIAYFVSRPKTEVGLFLITILTIVGITALLQWSRIKTLNHLQLSDNILKRISNLVLVADGTGQIVYVSPAVKNILGYTPKELLGNGWWEQTHQDPEERAQERNYIAKAARGEIAIDQQHESVVQRKDGEARNIYWYDSRGPSDLIIGVGIDITEQKEAERALQKSEQKLRAIIENTPDAIYIKDTDRRYQLINPAVERLYGWDKNKILGYKDEELFNYSEVKEIIKVDEQLLANQEIMSYERNIKINGKPKTFLSIKYPFYSEEGELQGLIAISREITRQKEYEKKIEKVNKELEATNRDLTDSINYAERIQRAMIPKPSDLENLLPQSFVLFKPRDIVSGDFYWYTEKSGKIIVAACDCTGHGVPGAFMSLISNELLNQVVNEEGYTQPDQILHRLDEEIKRVLQQKRKNRESLREGMDLALCTIDYNKQELSFAGAYRPLVYVRSGHLREIKASPYPIGHFLNIKKRFTTQNIKFKEGDVFYIFSDGYPDQFGGPKGKKYMTKRFKRLLSSISSYPPDQQKSLLKQELTEWQGDEPQVDDILVIGFRL